MVELLSLLLLVGQVADDSLAGRWTLDALPAVDSGPNKLPTQASGPLKPADEKSLAFDGVSTEIRVADAPPLDLGRGDFTLSLSLFTGERLTDDPGDLLSKYDPAARRGFTLGLRCNTGVTSCQPNWRQLQFGIDSGSTPKWRDEGRPGNALLGFAMCVHEGHLYAGTCEPGATETGHVYRYDGPGKWSDLGALDGSNSVSALAVWNGKLYAGTARYRVAGSALQESPNTTLGGRIFRRDGDRWTDLGQLPQTEAVGGLVVYDGRLYAASLFKPAGFFRLEDDGKTWTSLPVPNGQRVEALGIFNGHLYATSYDGGKVYRYDGKAWTDLGLLGDNTQTYSFATHNGRLHVGTWRSGKVFRLGAADAWEDAGRLGEELEVMGMIVHNGQLYAGTLPLAEVYRHDGKQSWTRIEQLDRTPDVKYRRVWTMAQFQGRLFCSTLPSGHIHSLEAGACVTHDRELSPGWHRVAAVRAGGRLRLHVDGELVAESAPFEAQAFDISNEVPLQIGNGPADHFHGRLKDVRIHRTALSAEELRK